MAHIRMAMDWSRYIAYQIAASLQRNESSITLPNHDDCSFQLTFQYPKYWENLSPLKKSQLIDELSLRIGERVTFDIMTWHEIITWFGFGNFIVWSEKSSAFTYEDTMSHVIGIYAADAALRYPVDSWNKDATRALETELRAVGVVSKANAQKAVESVRELWWSHGSCVRRMVDVGERDNEVHPWLIDEMTNRSIAPLGYKLPSLQGIDADMNFQKFYTLLIKPGWLIPRRVRESCIGDPQWINPPRDFPRLLEIVRHEVKMQFGVTADEPHDY